MKARRWDGRDEADDEVAGLEQECAGAVFSNALESELELAVGAELEAVLSKRRARDIPAKALQLATVVAIDRSQVASLDSYNREAETTLCGSGTSAACCTFQLRSFV